MYVYMGITKRVYKWEKCTKERESGIKRERSNFFCIYVETNYKGTPRHENSLNKGKKNQKENKKA